MYYWSTAQILPLDLAIDMYKLYCLKSEEEVFYVGMTSKSLQERLSQHIRESKKGKSYRCKKIKKILKEKREKEKRICKNWKLNI